MFLLVSASYNTYSSILFGKDSCEAPWLVLQRLHILDLHDEYVSRLSSLDIERTGQVVNSGEIDISHVIGRVIIANLSSRPVHAFDLDSLAILDVANGGDCIMVRSQHSCRLVASETHCRGAIGSIGGFFVSFAIAMEYGLHGHDVMHY